MQRLRTRLRAGASTFPSATFALNFLTGGLDPAVTFSRGSNATLVDSTGKITYAPANLLLQSQTFDSGSWVKTSGGVAIAPVVTADAATAPDGTMTADLVQFNLNGGTTSTDRSRLQQSVTLVVGTNYVSGLYLKAATPSDVGKTVRITISGATGGQNITLTDSYQRVGQDGAAAQVAGVLIIEARGTLNDDQVAIFLWGAQLEPVTYQTTSSTYVATTTAAYYGPRFDYDPVTLAAKGLLIEEQRTNLLLRSEEFDNASWTKTRSSVVANATTSPDGTVNADKLVEDATAANNHFTSQAFISTAIAYTFTVYAKAAERGYVTLFNSTVASGTCFDLITGVVGVASGTPPTASTITAVGNGWYRCSITVTATAASNIWRINVMASNSASTAYDGDGTSGIYLWGAQLEAGAFATSYIPTVASQVTRSADVATMTGTNFSSWYNQSEGTFVAEFDVSGFVANQRVFEAGDGTGANFIGWYSASGSHRLRVTNAAATTSVIGLNSPPAAGVIYKEALAFQTGNCAISVDAATVATLGSTIPTGLNKLNIGSATPTDGNQLNGHIRQIAYYNTRLPNATLQALTA